MYTYIYGLVFRVPTPGKGMGPPGSTPFPPICKLLAAFVRSSLVLYLLGLCSTSDYQTRIYWVHATF